MQSWPPNPTLIRVLEIQPSDGHFRFGGGQPYPFVEVDWFHDGSQISPDYPTIADEDGRRLLEENIRQKNYFNESKAYLVLSALGTFTINYQGG